eukprot:Colp12_sorted_trinity150504_noHs@26591
MSFLSVRLTELKHVKSIAVAFNPFAPNNTTAREFYRLMETQKLKKTNNNMVLKATIGRQVVEPTIEVEYSDGKKELIRPQKSEVDSAYVVRHVANRCRLLSRNEWDEPDDD